MSLNEYDFDEPEPCLAVRCGYCHSDEDQHCRTTKRNQRPPHSKRQRDFDRYMIEQVDANRAADYHLGRASELGLNKGFSDDES